MRQRHRSTCGDTDTLPATAMIQTKRIKPVDFSTQGGLWVPCAGSVTPWQTHIGSEEYPPDARSYYEQTMVTDSSVRTFLRFWGHYASEVSRQEAENVGFYPYQYGYPWETKVTADFEETTTKLYAHGRQSYEMSYVMPDEKTVYSTDDGTNCVFSMFVANNAQDIKEGVNYCMKMTQTSAVNSLAKDFTADVTWIAMPTPTHAEAEAAIKTTKFADLFDSEACNSDGTCPSAGFSSINVGSCECLRVKPGMDKLAGVFEKRRMAGDHCHSCVYHGFDMLLTVCTCFDTCFDMRLLTSVDGGRSVPRVHGRVPQVGRLHLRPETSEGLHRDLGGRKGHAEQRRDI